MPLADNRNVDARSKNHNFMAATLTSLLFSYTDKMTGTDIISKYGSPKYDFMHSCITFTVYKPRKSVIAKCKWKNQCVYASWIYLAAELDRQTDRQKSCNI